METAFWKQVWTEQNIAFHGKDANPLLVKYFNRLGLAEGSRVFLPLCGKTLDIHWLLANGYRVAGAELSELAIGQLFKELAVAPTITRMGALQHYSAPNIDIYVGDIFQLTNDILGKVDAVYDRAALVALPEEMRSRYTNHLLNITNKVPQLLICYVYDQAIMQGPPFSISNKEVKQHYAATYKLSPLETVEVAGGIRGQYPAMEHVWLLEKL